MEGAPATETRLGKSQISILDHRDGTGAISKRAFSLKNRETASGEFVPLAVTGLSSYDVKLP